MKSYQILITQHIRYGLTPLPFGILLPLVATLDMLGTLDAVDLPFLVRSYSLEIENIAKQKGWFLGTDSDAIIKEIQKKI